MPKTLRALALSAFFVAALAFGLTACGGDWSDDSVAKVDQQSIKRSTFDHWMRVVAISAQGQQNPTATTTPKAQVPDPPEFTQCVATKRKTAPKPAKGQPEVTDAQRKQQCKQEYDQFSQQVLSFLIRSTWLSQEAEKQRVKVSEKEVLKQLDDQRKQAQLDDEDAWQKFLVRAGMTTADILFQQRGSLLERKVTDRLTKRKTKVTDAQIQAYYEKNKQRFSQPERRDLLLVKTATEAKAKEAKAALQSGRSWNSVVKEFSNDEATKSQGGRFKAVTKGQQEKAFDDAVFAAAKGMLSGPVKTQFGWYLFEVTKITEGTQQSLADSKETIRQQLIQEAEQKALTKFGTDYRKRWKAATECAKGFIVDDCSNADKKKKANTSTVPPGAQTDPTPRPTTPTETPAP